MEETLLTKYDFVSQLLKIRAGKDNKDPTFLSTVKFKITKRHLINDLLLAIFEWDQHTDRNSDVFYNTNQSWLHDKHQLWFTGFIKHMAASPLAAIAGVELLDNKTYLVDLPEDKINEILSKLTFLEISFTSL